jgi:3-dehydroquinate dehydratase
VDNKEN